MRYANYRGDRKMPAGTTDGLKRHKYLNSSEKEVFMDKQELQEDRLWSYIDGSGDAAERSAVAQLIAENHEWKTKYKELLEVHQLMTSTALEAPSMRFTKNVMEQITLHKVAPATKSYINTKVIWGIGGFFMLMITGFLVYLFGQVNWTSPAQSSTGSFIANYDIGKRIDLSKIASSGFINIFLLINIILGFILLDMHLQRKKARLTAKTS